ncbi:hypothetical protein [Alteromonas macleodii]|uniref:hypothetical protein n=1 Tax=Alteromonas macleodii TaxID=28108 RepID=UPI003140645A|tara:strand:- start:22095 stop:22349 length:255 start_codon:yes stop_codon:yes gene_type:complete
MTNTFRNIAGDIQVERRCDMGDGFKLQVMKSKEDGDIHVAVLPENHRATSNCVEFCASGTKSPHTYAALLNLIEAMKKDSFENP